MTKAIYIHIPFCHRICPYCDFNKYVFKGQPVDQYLLALVKEMHHAREIYGVDEPITSVFLGGGTPSILDLKQLSYLFEGLFKVFPIDQYAEISMEINPETVTKEKLNLMYDAKVNRLSFGVQTFQPHLLRKLGRLHTTEEIYQSIEWAKGIGFHNISIDLMFGLPEQNYQDFRDSLDQALALEIPHISAYSLKVEEGTFFHRLEQKGKLALPDEEQEVKMYRHLIDTLNKHGIYQYEISNFAKPGFESTHNKTYWKNQNYFGLGAGAHGYLGNMRYINAYGVEEYINQVQQKGLPIIDQHYESQREEIENTMIMGLRLREGINKEHFYKRYQLNVEQLYAQQLYSLQEKGLLIEDQTSLYLSDKGVFLANEVFEAFLHDAKY